MRAMIIILLAVITAGIRAGTNPVNHNVVSEVSEVLQIANLTNLYWFSEVTSTNNLYSDHDVYIYEGSFTNSVIVKGTNGVERTYHVVNGELKEVLK